MIFNVPLQKKESEMRTNSCTIDKVVELSQSEYAAFYQDLLDEYDFIKENANALRRDENGINHGLLVLGEGLDDGIFVITEGYDYARYTAFVPNARQLLAIEQHPALKEFGDEMIAVVDQYAKRAVESQQNGTYRILKCDLQSARYNSFNDELFSEMLNERPEVEYAEEIDDEIFITISSEFINTEDENNLRKLTAQDVEVMCAKHILWSNDAGGEQADFSNCLLKDLDLSRKSLNGANFDGAKIVNANLDCIELCFATCNNTKFCNCSAINITAEEAEFKGAKFIGDDFGRVVFTHSNFSGAEFRDCSIGNSSFRSCCLDGTEFGDTNMFNVNTNDCSYDEQDWSEDSGPVISM